MEFKYKKNLSREERIKESAQLRINYPDKLPVILEKDPASKIVELKKTKYLLPKKSTVIFAFSFLSFVSSNYWHYYLY